MMTPTTPEIVGGSCAAYWLDLRCPACGRRSRIGVSCPDGGKSCVGCGAVIDFWSAWWAEALREADRRSRKRRRRDNRHE